MAHFASLSFEAVIRSAAFALRITSQVDLSPVLSNAKAVALRRHEGGDNANGIRSQPSPTCAPESAA
jgi:hypothetical protein